MTLSAMDDSVSRTKGRRERGAALVVVLAILAVLLAIGLSYFAVTRIESQIATNVVNNVRAEQLLDGAFSIAQYQLNVDLDLHPNVTSNDFSWKSLFNGTAFIGKAWAYRQGLAQFDISDVEQALRAQRPEFSQSMLYVKFEDGYREILFRGPRTLPWLWIPRASGNNILLYLPESEATLCNRDGQSIDDVAANSVLASAGLPWRFSRAWQNAPWVLPSFHGNSPAVTNKSGYPLELIHEWADIDTDGDGFRDAVWVPIPKEIDLSRDGVDNDLDGDVDPVDLRPEAIDAQGLRQRYFEPGVFVYRWLDKPDPNVSGGRIQRMVTNLEEEDPADIAQWSTLRLTVPLPGATTIIDLNNDGVISDADRLPNGQFAFVRIPDTIPVVVSDSLGTRTVTLTLNDVDTLDNDYDRFVNGFQLYACTDEYAAKRSGMKLLKPELFYGPPGVWPEIGTYGLNKLWVGCTGEPVCTIIGRVAISVTDEASKVNLNTAGGFRYGYDPYVSLNNPTVPFIRSFGQGTSPFEYEFRMLPDMGVNLTARLWGWRTGAGIWTSANNVDTRLPNVTTNLSPANPDISKWDQGLPGYGRVDDNVNSLILAFNRRDDNGDGIFDTGIGINPPPEYRHPLLQAHLISGSNPNGLPAQVLNRKPDVLASAFRLGLLEGIDEPEELQFTRPLRHLPAEQNGTDDDRNGVTDERGELGDKVFNDVSEVERLNQFGSKRMKILKTTTTAQSDSRNVFYINTPRGKVAINKVDPNYATPLQLASTFMLAENLGPNFNFDSGASPATQFAAGLRRGDATLTGYMFGSGYTLSTGTYVLANAEWQTYAADPFLRALQMAVNLVDNRDRDARASRITLPKEHEGRMLNERERTPPKETLPLDLIKDFKVNSLASDPNDHNLDNTDPWWASVSGGQGRRISYTVAGADAIRINEVMARPVRRVEAETNRLDKPSVLTNPSPYGLPPFNVNSSGGTVESASNYLGDRTVVKIAPGEIYEIVIRPSDWVLPPGRYYLMVNVTDSSGNMSIPDPNITDPNITDFKVLDYCIRYTDPAEPPMTDPAAYDLFINTLIQNTLAVFAPPPDSRLEAEVTQLRQTLYDLTNWDDIWQTVDNPAYLATPQRKQKGIGTPVGWVFLPSRRSELEPSQSTYPEIYNWIQSTYPEIYNWIQTTQGLTSPEEIQEWFKENIWNAVTGRFFADDLFGTPGKGVETYTVSIPDAASNLELRIALRINPSASGIVSINFFDLSQEPDHEWIELVNTSDEAVDLSGWKLEIGIPDAPGTVIDPAMGDPNKSKWTIPPGTVIAPKGYLLLAFAEPPNGDQYANDPDENRFYDNGIGLKRSGNPAYLSNVTVPPIATRMETSLATAIGTTIPALADPTYSVFDRPDGNAAFIDNDGDGLSSIDAVTGTGNPPTLSSDLDNALAELATENNIRNPLRGAVGLPATVATTPAFARIVSLQNDQLFQVNSVNAEEPPYPPSGPIDAWDLSRIKDDKDVARVLLRGGILPNYPDHDGYDNDGDGGYLVTRSAEWYFVPGTLDTDNIDNNLDGYVDVYCGYGFGNAANQKPAVDALSLPLYSEGVDEGNIALGVNIPRLRYGYGSYAINRYEDNVNSLESGTFPMAANPALDPNTALKITDTLGITVPTPLRGVSQLWYDGDPVVRNPFLLVNSSCNFDPHPATGPLDSPDWIAFVERRWNPGDCVVISLYAGEPSPDTLVDRVTYSEYDVINRTIDDIALCPYPESLARPSYWPPNHMALDFYRSLERKHPLYSGDLHGTSNRWEATDGAYDDWADSLSWFEAVQDRSNADDTITERIQPRFNLTGFPSLASPHHNRNLRLFGHAMFGSPLRMNTQTRLWENPPDLLAVSANNLYVGEEPQINPGLAYGSQEPALTARLPLRQFSFYGVSDAAFREPPSFAGSNYLTLGEFWVPPVSPAEARNLKSRDFPTHLLRRSRISNSPYASAGDWLDVPLFSFHYWLGRVIPRDLDGNGAPDVNTPRGIQSTINVRYFSYYHQDGPREEAWPPLSASGLPVQTAFQREDVSLKGVTLASMTGSAAPEHAGLNTLALTAEMEPLILTVGQADFIPLWPNPVESPDPLNTGASPEQVYKELLTWRDNSLGGWTWKPETGMTNVTYLTTLPAMWTPVLLFGESSVSNAGTVNYPRYAYPDYPVYARSWSTYGANPRPVNAAAGFLNALVPVPYLFEFKFLADQKVFELDPNQLPNGTTDIADRLDRVWPVEKRPVMYLSSHPAGMADRDRAEALFVWDAEDGLENGSYIAYIGTFIPGMHRKLVDADRMVQAARGQNPAQRNNSGLPFGPDAAPLLARAKAATGTIWPPTQPPDYTTAATLALDPERYLRNVGEPEFTSWLTVEFYTDPRKAKLMSPPKRVLNSGESYPDALEHPEDWFPPQGPDNQFPLVYCSDSNGMIFYSTDSETPWMPKLVHVTNQFLALRVRNVSPAGSPACVTCVVLTPVPRTRSRINVNTAENRLAEVGNEKAIFNALLGLPGVVAAAYTTRNPDVGNLGAPLGDLPKPDDDMGTPKVPAGNDWPPPDLLTNGLPIPPAQSTAFAPQSLTEIQRLLPGGNVRDGNFKEDQESVASLRLAAMLMALRPEHPDGRYYRAWTDLLNGLSDGIIPEDAVTPLSNEMRPDWRSDEIIRRFSGLAQLITLRSDVFEIQAVAQAGSAVDLNGDGYLDYASTGEGFQVTAESRGRMIYERRARRDTSDLPPGRIAGP